MVAQIRRGGPTPPSEVAPARVGRSVSGSWAKHGEPSIVITSRLRSVARRRAGIAISFACTLTLMACSNSTGSAGSAAVAQTSDAAPDVLETAGPALQGDCPEESGSTSVSDPTASRHAPTSYTVHMIAPPAQQGEARAVNARGDIAGQLDSAAFVCHNSRILTYPGVQYETIGDVYSSIATAINGDGVAAGSDGAYFPCSMSGLEFATAVIFRDQRMDYVDHTRIGTCTFEVDGINDAGVIVGESGYRGFVRYPDGHEIEVQPLSTRPEYNGTRASALDNEGHVVGGTTIPQAMQALDINSYVIHAFLATFADGHQRMRDLGALPDFPDTYATAISEDLTIVGYSGTESGAKWTRVSGPSHAWVWQHGHMTDLGAHNLQSTYAYGVNDTGIVVGCSETSAVRWADKRFEDLNNLIGADSGWHLTCARAINRRGIIVGTGIYQGHPRPFRLEPLK